MEANEAMRRVFWRHRWLLIAFLLIPPALIAPLRLTQRVTYAASASIQAQAAAPDADTQVTAILSRVTAVATSPSIVQGAIKAAGLNLNAIDVARKDISVASLGSSAVVTLTITNPSRPVAIRLGQSLAHSIVGVLNGLGTQSSQQLAALAVQRGHLQVNRAKLLKKLAAAQAGKELANSAGVQALIAELNAVEAQLSANGTSVQQVLSVSTVNQGAGVISTPAYAISVSRHVAVYAALASLLGLVVGLLIATLHELARPTVAEPGAGARELGLVLLGNAELTNGQLADLQDDLATRLDLAAHRLAARTLVLTGPVPPAQLTTLAAHLDANLPDISGSANGDGTLHADHLTGITPPHAQILPAAEHRPGAAEAKSPTGTFGTIGPHSLGPAPGRSGLIVAALPDITLRGRPKVPALVLVLPRFAPRAALDQAVDLGVATGWPLLGVIGLRQRRRRRRRSAPQPQPASVPRLRRSAATDPWPPPATDPWPPPATGQKAGARAKAAAPDEAADDEPAVPDELAAAENASAPDKADQQGAAS